MARAIDSPRQRDLYHQRGRGAGSEALLSAELQFEAPECRGIGQRRQISRQFQFLLGTNTNGHWRRPLLCEKTRDELLRARRLILTIGKPFLAFGSPPPASPAPEQHRLAVAPGLSFKIQASDSRLRIVG